MSSRNFHPRKMVVLAMLLAFAAPALPQDESDMSSTADCPMHGESAAQHDESAPRAPEFEPAIPAGMTLEEVFNFAESPPPSDFPEPLSDDKLYAFTMFKQLEYRVATDDETADHLGWEAQGWIGGDFNQFWWKNEGEAVFDGPDEGETETGVVALQGLAPFQFELDNSLYISEEGDVTFAIEAQYDLRITQRLVLQQRAEMGFALQDILERSLGAGMTDVKLDLRLRYEIKREFALYVGVRSQFLVGETDSIAEASGEDSEQLFFLAGFRVAPTAADKPTGPTQPEGPACDSRYALASHITKLTAKHCDASHRVRENPPARICAGCAG